MEFTIKITNEELLNLILEQKKDNETNEVIEEPVKRGRGRPRVHPMKDPNAPKRKVGRPRKFKCLS
jgi:hypothetical protein